MLQSALGYIRWSVLLAATANTTYCLINHENRRLRLRLESDGVRQVDSGIVHMLLDAVSLSQAEEQGRRPEDKLTLNKH